MLASLFVGAANHLLSDARWARERLAPYSGHLARFSVGEIAIDFSIDHEGFLAEAAAATEPEVCIQLPAPTPAELADGLEALIGRARINGQVEMADALGFVFRNLRWDIEADLAKVVGDAVAYRLYGSMSRLLVAQKEFAASLTANLREFVAEGGSPALPRAQWSARSERLSALRDAVARLEKRVARVETGLSSQSAASSGR